MRLLSIPIFLLALAANLYGSITGVYNAASWVPPSLPSSGVAQGAIFTVYGSGLGPPTIQYAESYPLPTTQGLAGTTIQVTVGSTTQTCIMLYTVATQAAAVLPSGTPTGTGTLTLSYQGAKSSFAILVVPANFGTFTLNQSGSGPAVVTDVAFNPITYVNPAHPGDILILWGTGLGAVAGDETEPPQSVDLGTGVKVFVENQPATVLYGGRASSAGLDQINFVVPTTITGGCKTSIAVVVKGVVGNVVTTAIAPPGQTTCGDSYGALTTANMQTALSKGSLNIATVWLTHVGTEDEELIAGFRGFPLSTLVESYGGDVGPSIGSCISYTQAGSSLVISDPVPGNLLDSGPTLTITGPAGTKTFQDNPMGTYVATLGAGSPDFLAPGTFSASNGNGGANVGAFNWRMTLPPPISPTNIPATFSRSQDLTLTWSGGASFPLVSIFGYAGVPQSFTQTSYVEFVCNASGPAGQFTVPSVILGLLPTNGYGAQGIQGAAFQLSGVASNTYTIAGTPGIDVAVFGAFTSTGSIAKVQ